MKNKQSTSITNEQELFLVKDNAADISSLFFKKFFNSVKKRSDGQLVIGPISKSELDSLIEKNYLSKKAEYKVNNDRWLSIEKYFHSSWVDENESQVTKTAVKKEVIENIKTPVLLEENEKSFKNKQLVSNEKQFKKKLGKKKLVWIELLPLFVIVAVSSLAIFFNFKKQSPVIENSDSEEIVVENKLTLNQDIPLDLKPTTYSDFLKMSGSNNRDIDKIILKFQKNDFLLNEKELDLLKKFSSPAISSWSLRDLSTNLLAVYFFNQNNIDKSTQILNLHLNSASDSKPTLLNLSLNNLSDPQNLSLAKTYFDKAEKIKVEKFSTVAAVIKGLIFIEEKKYFEAQTIFSNLSEDEPHNYLYKVFLAGIIVANAEDFNYQKISIKVQDLLSDFDPMFYNDHLLLMPINYQPIIKYFNLFLNRINASNLLAGKEVTKNILKSFANGLYFNNKKTIFDSNNQVPIGYKILSLILNNTKVDLIEFLNDNKFKLKNGSVLSSFDYLMFGEAFLITKEYLLANQAFSSALSISSGLKTAKWGIVMAQLKNKQINLSIEGHSSLKRKTNNFYPLLINVPRPQWWQILNNYN